MEFRAWTTCSRVRLNPCQWVSMPKNASTMSLRPLRQNVAMLPLRLPALVLAHVVILLATACAPAASLTSTPQPAATTVPPAGNSATGPITSAPDPADPVPFRWTLQDGALLLQGGTLHTIPSEVRLLGPSGQVVGRASATPVQGSGDCPEGAGVARAEVALPGAVQAAFQSDQWPDTYALEVLVGGTWRPTTLTAASCK